MVKSHCTVDVRAYGHNSHPQENPSDSLSLQPRHLTQTDPASD